MLKSTTPKIIDKLGLKIAKEMRLDIGSGFKDPLENTKNTYNMKSYTPSINKLFTSLKSIPRENLVDCNNELAFQLKEPLMINVNGECYPYYSDEAKHLLRYNLSANKHVTPNKIVPPIQKDSNCWFNTMFATLFISDKGRKFFHYFRNLMVEGKQSNGNKIPEELANAFSLLNFAIDSALTGSKYAYQLDTNQIIKQIYKAIPFLYRKMLPYIVTKNAASNPIKYFMSITNYLGDSSLQILFLPFLNLNWKETLSDKFKELNHLPHLVIFEIGDKESGKFIKEEEFEQGGAIYRLDSTVVRNTEQMHFCATIMCDDNEMGYDGVSFHRLVPMKWKKLLNEDEIWSFEGSQNEDNSQIEWNFRDGYQLLLYYRIQ